MQLFCCCLLLLIRSITDRKLLGNLIVRGLAVCNREPCLCGCSAGVEGGSFLPSHTAGPDALCRWRPSPILSFPHVQSPKAAPRRSFDVPGAVYHRFPQ